MLNPITFTVTGESGPLQVTASGLDYAAYEDTYDKAAITAIGEGRYVAYVFLVWHAMHRQELTELTFEEFLATTPQFGPGETEDVVPLESSPPSGSPSISDTSSD
jgi:hypothetical protein